ncbi:MAG: DUF4836 family protein [Cytophagales bacterium]|nr:MAG: DUF4836 family protein [Cytophagales bacterium]
MKNHKNPMRKFRTLMALLPLFLLQTCSFFNSPPEYVRYIPDNVTWVVSFQLQNMTTKTPELPQVLAQGIMRIFATIDSQEWKDSGIDWTKQAYQFGFLSDNKADNYQALIIGVKEIEKFKNFVEKGLKVIARQEKGFNFVILQENTVLAWSNQNAWIINKEGKVAEDKLKTLLFSLAEKPTDKPLYENNQEFRNLGKEKYDINFWINLVNFSKFTEEAFNDNMIPLFGTILPAINFKDTYFTSVLNFEKGEIVIDSKLYLTENYAKFSTLFKTNIDEKLVANIPVQKPMNFAAVALNTSEVAKMIQSNPIIALFLKPALNEIGFTSLEGLLQIFTGDMAYALKDVKKTTFTTTTINQQTGETESEVQNRLDYQFIAGFALRDKPALQKLLTTLLEQDKIIKKNEIYMVEWKVGQFLYLLEKDNYLYVFTNETYKNDFFKKEALTMDGKFREMAKTNFLITFSNVEKDNRNRLPSIIFGEDKLSEQIVKKVDTPIENFMFGASTIKNNVIPSRTIIKMTSADKNALSLLADFFKATNAQKVAQ